jgi:LEA14-like dessication related protein
MPKYCPQCGQVYGEAARFCDQEGTELVSASHPTAEPPGRRRGWKAWVIGLGLLVAVLAGTFYAVTAYFSKNIAVTFESFAVPQKARDGANDVSGLVDRAKGVARALSGTGDLIARVRVKNSTALSGRITAASYTIFLNDEEVGQGTWAAPEGEAVALDSSGEAVFDLPMRLHPGNALSGALDGVTGEGFSFKIKGDLTLSVMVAHFRVPFTVNHIQVAIPAAGVRDL